MPNLTWTVNGKNVLETITLSCPKCGQVLVSYNAAEVKRIKHISSSSQIVCKCGGIIRPFMVTVLEPPPGSLPFMRMFQ